MSFSKQIRAKSFTEARAIILGDETVPNYVSDVVRELAAHAPHLGEGEGEIDGHVIEINVSGHVDEKSFDVKVAVAYVADGTAARTSTKKR